MYPELFSIGPITVYSYGVLLAVSYLLGLRLAMSRAKKWGLDANRVLDLGIYIIIAALIGAKLLLLVVDFDQFRQSRHRAVGIEEKGCEGLVGVELEELQIEPVHLDQADQNELLLETVEIGIRTDQLPVELLAGRSRDAA